MSGGFELPSQCRGCVHTFHCLYQGLWKKALFPIYVFVLLEGIFWGFGSWWIMYLYIWAVLWGITMLCRRNDSSITWAIINGAYGLSFGALCSITQGVMFGIGSGFAYFISGIPFDIAHCIGNFFTALFLYKPLTILLSKARKMLVK